MTTVAAKMMLQCVVNGSLSMNETDIEQRPYHRNCSCALHKPKGALPTACFQHGTVSFPKKHLLNDCSMSVESPKFSSQSFGLNETAFRNREDTNEALLSRWQKLQPC